MPSVFFQQTPAPHGLLLFCLLGFVGGIAAFLYGFRLLRRRRLILDTPFSKIRSASMGMVELSGLAVGPYTMIAPLSSKPCYYHRSVVWEWKQEGKDKAWVKVAAESMHVPFFLDDNTGRVLVDPRGADLDLHCDFKQEFNGSFFSNSDIAPGNVNLFLSRHGVVTSNRIKVEEYCIKPKNALFILGTLGENPGIEVTPAAVADSTGLNSFTPQGFTLSVQLFGRSNEFATGSPVNPALTHHQTRAREVVRLSNPSGPVKSSEMTQQQKVAAALMKAGIVNPAAWTAAGTAPADVVESNGVQILVDQPPQNSAPTDDTSAQVNGFSVRPAVVLKKGANDKTFLISWRSQRELARSLGWKCVLAIWGGPILTLISLYFFFGLKSLF